MTKSLKCRHIEIADNVDQARSCPLFIGLFVVFIKGEQNQSTQHLCRRSHQRCSVRKGIQRNFKKFTGKHLCQSLFFNKVAGLRLWHRCFSENFVKFLRTTFSQNTSWRLLLPMQTMIKQMFYSR